MTLLIIKEQSINRLRKALTILLVEGNARERVATQQMMEKTCLLHQLYHVESPRELMDYLRRRGRYADPRFSPRPDYILLNLNLSTKEVNDALRQIQGDYRLKDLPIALLGQPKERHAYRRYHASYSFIVKPVTSVALINQITAIKYDL